MKFTNSQYSRNDASVEETELRDIYFHPFHTGSGERGQAAQKRGQTPDAAVQYPCHPRLQERQRMETECEYTQIDHCEGAGDCNKVGQYGIGGKTVEDMQYEGRGAQQGGQ